MVLVLLLLFLFLSFCQLKNSDNCFQSFTCLFVASRLLDTTGQTYVRKKMYKKTKTTMITMMMTMTRKKATNSLCLSLLLAFWALFAIVVPLRRILCELCMWGPLQCRCCKEWQWDCFSTTSVTNVSIQFYLLSGECLYALVSS